MNIRHINLGIWAYMSMSSYLTGIVMGIYGRNRMKYSNDFTYNKYHFAVQCNVASGIGLMLTSKVK